MWAMLNHEFVLPFLGIYIQQEEMFFVSPFMENGTLAQWRKNAKPPVTEICERVWLLFFCSSLILTPNEDTGSRPRHGIHSLRRDCSW